MADVSQEREEKEKIKERCQPHIRAEAKDTQCNIKHAALTCHRERSHSSPLAEAGASENKLSSYVRGELPCKGEWTAARGEKD